MKISGKIVIVLVGLTVGARAHAQAGPRALAAAADVEESFGARIPLDARFRDGAGKQVRLGELLDDRRPVVLVLAYYRCPMLCDLVLAGVTATLRQIGWAPGRDFRGITVSIDPKDTPATAHAKQIAVLQAMGQTGAAAEAGWPFLSGDAANIRALADSVGFRYAYDPRTDQYAHPAMVTILTPDGRVSRYLYGVSFRLLDVRLALTEAARGRVGTLVERVLLTCFRYDPSTRRYGFYVSAVLKGGASCALLAVGGFLTALWARDARGGRRRPRGGEGA